jgi:hypothetical protein
MTLIIFEARLKGGNESRNPGSVNAREETQREDLKILAEKEGRNGRLLNDQ